MDKIGSKKQMVNDIISVEEASSWVKGECILIEAQTGRGKTTFIKEQLKAIAKSNGKKILLLSPRKLLKIQNEEDLENDETICFKNYQEIEYLYRNKINIGFFDYIIADECHYIYSDATFNTSTDLTWKWLKSQNNSIRIFMSATMELFKSLLIEEKILCNNYYHLEPNYEYVDKLYYYDNDTTVENILKMIPGNEKAIYFAMAYKAYKTYEKHKDQAAFICSENNTDYNKYVNTKVRDEITNKNKNLSCKILCATSVLDEGISIYDKSFKHIIVDMLDIDTIIQMIGRRRVTSYNVISNDDKIKIYIKKQSPNDLRKYHYYLNREKKQGDYFIENGSYKYVERSLKKEKSKLIDFVVISEQKNKKIECLLNEIMYKKFSSLINDIERYKADANEYFNDLSRKLNVNRENFICFVDELKQKVLIEIKDLLNSLLSKELFEEQQEEIKEHLTNLTHRNLRGDKTKLTTINKIFDENNLPYIVKSGRKRMKKQQKRYWIITNKEE